MKLEKNSLASVEALVAAADAVEVSSLQAAVNEAKARAAKVALEKNIALINAMDAHVNSQVNQLREVRKQEKNAIAQVKKFADARAAFLKSGNLEEYNKATGQYLR